MSDELPKLFSDEEFTEQRLLRERRELADRRAEELRAEKQLEDERRALGDRRVSPTKGRRQTDGLPESTIEQRFPHIAKKIVISWSSDACAAYIMSLTVADRPGRQGFPEEVMEDLMMLHGVNEILMGKSAVPPEAELPPAWKEALRRKQEALRRKPE